MKIFIHLIDGSMAIWIIALDFSINTSDKILKAFSYLRKKCLFCD